MKVEGSYYEWIYSSNSYFYINFNLDYEESFKLIDTRLLISTVAVLFALFALVWDYFYPFPLSQNVLMTCSVSTWLC